MYDSIEKKIDISILIPLYNEEKVIPTLYSRIENIRLNFNKNIEVILVDDGSTDNSIDLIKEIAKSNKNYQAIILSRNFGHQAALIAGLRNVRAKEAVMIIDADLQDQPELLGKFYSYYLQGYDVVYGIRKKRKENFIKKFLYYLFYRILKKTSRIYIPVDSGDFCLMSRRVVDIINQIEEESVFLRGIRSWVGFKQIGIEYERQERLAGKSKYTMRKLLKLAFDGFFNFSTAPIKFIFIIGMLAILVAFIYFIYVLYYKFFVHNVPLGYTSLLFIIIFFGGLNLLSIALLGEYIVRIFFQVKKRPLYVIKEIIRDSENGK